MAATVRCKIDATEFSREQFKQRLAWWTDRALEIESPTRWVERFDGGTNLRHRYRWELFAEVGDEVVSLATVIGALPRLAITGTRIAIDSAVPGFDRLMAEALRTRRRDAIGIMVRRCVVEAQAPERAETSTLTLDPAIT